METWAVFYAKIILKILLLHGSQYCSPSQHDTRANNQPPVSLISHTFWKWLDEVNLGTNTNVKECSKNPGVSWKKIKWETNAGRRDNLSFIEGT